LTCHPRPRQRERERERERNGEEDVSEVEDLFKKALLVKGALVERERESKIKQNGGGGAF
jgi:hypothetical protein